MSIGDPKRRKLAEPGPLVWLEEGGPDLMALVKPLWGGVFVDHGQILLRTACFEACEKTFLFLRDCGCTLTEKGLLLCAAGGGRFEENCVTIFVFSNEQKKKKKCEHCATLGGRSESKS